MQHAALRAAFGFVGLLWVNAVFFGHLGFLKTAAARGKWVTPTTVSQTTPVIAGRSEL